MTDRPIYLDNAASTPVRPEVAEVMHPYFSGETFGNPSSAHSFGRAARQGIDRARQEIAQAFHIEPTRVVFTAGGTEADNLAILGGALAARTQGRPFSVALSPVEHPAVWRAADAVRELGGNVIVLPMDPSGRIDLAFLERQLEAGVGVVSVMWVNNEVGTIHDVPEIARLCHAHATPFHTDAVQAVGKIPCAFDIETCPLLSLSGHKIGGPQGVGVLIVRHRKLIEPLTHGGGQQFGLRSGTENVPGIAGLGRAVALAVDEVDTSAKHYARLRDDLEARLLDAISDVHIVGRNGNRAPHISNVAIPGVDSQAMVMHLDLAGIACSAGSACATGTVQPSRALTALGVPPDLAIRSLRFSFFRQNTMADVDRVISVLPGIVEKVRGLATALGR